MSRPFEGQDAPFEQTAGNLAVTVTGRDSTASRLRLGARTNAG
jgi:hypothetical protein